MSANTWDRPRGEGGSGESVGGGGRRSWAEILGSSLPTSMNKNVLEVILEKDERGAFLVSESDCARMMRKIGIDPSTTGHVEAVQICPNGRGVILITLKDHIKTDEFCRFDVFVVTESGIRSTMVKSACKRDVVVTMKGIHPNTSIKTIGKLDTNI